VNNPIDFSAVKERLGLHGWLHWRASKGSDTRAELDERALLREPELLSA
jgi:hypothetical protein